MVFNRKRPGDVERSQIIEYKNLQVIDNESLKQLGGTQRKYAEEFGRYITRGKLDTPAPILVSKIEREAIALILKYRTEAKVDTTNPYLFAAPPGYTDPYFKAGSALKEFCIIHNLEPNKLTPTKLRKHLATVTSSFNTDLVKRISNYMGHSDKYHDNIYVQRPLLGDVIGMGEVLEFAAGNTTNNYPSHLIGDNANWNSSHAVENYDNNMRSSHTKGNMDSSCSSNTINNDGSLSPKHSTSFLHTPTQSDAEERSCTPEFSGNLNEESSDGDGGSRNSKKIKKGTRLTKKTTWSTPEKLTARKLFEQYLTEGSDNPSLETCQEFIHGNHVLKNRNAVQVKAWIIQEKKRINNSKFSCQADRGSLAFGLTDRWTHVIMQKH